MFFISSFLVYGNLSFDKGDLNIEDESYNIISNLNKIDEIVESKNTTEIFFHFTLKKTDFIQQMLQQIGDYRYGKIYSLMQLKIIIIFMDLAIKKFYHLWMTLKE